jgi:hypothetical protein
MSDQVRTTREPETVEQRVQREERLLRNRREQEVAVAKALDAAVRESIRLHGP